MKSIHHKGFWIWFWIVLLLVPGMGRCLDLSPAQRFSQATSLYQSRSYDSAARIFEDLISLGYHNASLYYDAGNAEYQAGRIGEGIYYFDKALALDPENSRIEENLQFANQHITDHEQSLPTLFFVNWEQELLAVLSPNGWVVASLATFWLLVTALGLRLTIWKDSRWPSTLILVFGFCFAISLTGALTRYRQITNPGFAIVIQPEVVVKTGPDPGSSDAFDIHEGLRIQIIDEAGNWEKIRMEDGRTGWVTQGDVRSL